MIGKKIENIFPHEILCQYSTHKSMSVIIIMLFIIRGQTVYFTYVLLERCTFFTFVMKQTKCISPRREFKPFGKRGSYFCYSFLVLII